MIGRHIGNYRIVTELGDGAMGEVYFAEHTVMGRRAAIKVIREELSTDDDMVQRFINEARQVNRIGHPNIVEITDFGQIDARYYIMMELLEGETLEARLERVGALSELEATRIASQVADALGAAHELGVVHRDLKPENIFLVSKLNRGDVVKVLDFGIAKLMHPVGGPGAASATRPGAILGTPHFMSPEQCRGEDGLDHRSDIYSLGVMLYRMLTGRVPFEADNIVTVLLAQMNDTPRAPRELRPELSSRIEAIVMKSLEKLPDDRFSDMAGFLAALEAKTLAAASIQGADTLEMKKRVDGMLSTKPIALPKDLKARPQLGAPPPLPNEARSPTILQQPPPLPGSRKTGVQPLPPELGATVLHPTAAEPVQDVSAAAEQSRRVGSRLARILVERIHLGKLVLPSMPLAARECIALLDNQQQQASNRIADAIGRDPIIASQVMRRANSALFGRGARVRTIEQAVARIGQRQLRAIMVDLSARQLFESRNPEIRKVTRGLWEHSTAVGVLSRALARRRRDVDPEMAYLAGLLHDVGKPVAASLLLEAERSFEEPPQAWLASGAWLGVLQECHREIGVALARSWDLPEVVWLTIARCERYSLEGPSSPTSVVCFANALAKQAGIYAGEVDRVQVEALVHEGQNLFRIDDKMLEGLMAELQEHESRQAGTNE